MNLNYLGELYDFIVYSLIKEDSRIYSIYKTYGDGNLFPSSWKNLYKDLIEYAKSGKSHVEYTKDLRHTSVTSQIVDIDFKNYTVHVRYPGSEDRVGVVMEEKSFYVFISLCSILRLYVISGGSGRYTDNMKSDSELILSYIGFKDEDYFELKEVIGRMLVMSLGVADIEIILDLMDYLSDNVHDEDKEFPVQYPKKLMISKPSTYYDDFEEKPLNIAFPKEDLNNDEDKDNKNIIKLTVNFNSRIQERFVQGFDEEISIDNFPDLTDKIFIDKGVTNDRNNELKFLKGDEKNIIAKLDYGLGDAVFKPYGTHKNWGGFLYHCKDVSINGNNGLFILISRRLSEMWIGIEDLFYIDYPNYYIPEEKKRYEYEEYLDEESSDEDDEYRYYDEDLWDWNLFRNGERSTKVDFIFECKDLHVVDIPDKNYILIIYKNKKRIDCIRRSCRVKVSTCESFRFDECKNIILDILSIDDIDISQSNNFLYYGKEYFLSELLNYDNKKYYLLNSEDDLDPMVIESSNLGSKIV